MDKSFGRRRSLFAQSCIHHAGWITVRPKIPSCHWWGSHIDPTLRYMGAWIWNPTEEFVVSNSIKKRQSQKAGNVPVRPLFFGGSWSNAAAVVAFLELGFFFSCFHPFEPPAFCFSVPAAKENIFIASPSLSLSLSRAHTHIHTHRQTCSFFKAPGCEINASSGRPTLSYCSTQCGRGRTQGSDTVSQIQCASKCFSHCFVFFCAV